MKYTPQVVEQICNLLKGGNTRKTSAIAAGISEETFYTWMREKLEFSESVKKAEEIAVARNVAIINKAAGDTWQAAAWWLERRRRDDFGKHDKVDINATVKDVTALNERELNAEIYRLLTITGTATIVNDAPEETAVLGLVQPDEAEPL
jgi:hypothetical protein